MISPQSTRAYLICYLLQEYSDRYTVFDTDSLTRGARWCQSWSWPFKRLWGEEGWLHTAPTQKRLLHGCSLYQAHEAHCPPLQPGMIEVRGHWSLPAYYSSACVESLMSSHISVVCLSASPPLGPCECVIMFLPGAGYNTKKDLKDGFLPWGRTFHPINLTGLLYVSLIGHCLNCRAYRWGYQQPDFVSRIVSFWITSGMIDFELIQSP